jgi:hypothetical protein
MSPSLEGNLFGAFIASSMLVAVASFQTQQPASRVGSALKATVDPSTITNKEYEDICGVSFDEGSLHDRLKFTNFLYPKHVDVIEDIGPVAGRMVDEIVSVGEGAPIFHHYSARNTRNLLE